MAETLAFTTPGLTNVEGLVAVYDDQLTVVQRKVPDALPVRSIVNSVEGGIGRVAMSSYLAVAFIEPNYDAEAHQGLLDEMRNCFANRMILSANGESVGAYTHYPFYKEELDSFVPGRLSFTEVIGSYATRTQITRYGEVNGVPLEIEGEDATVESSIYHEFDMDLFPNIGVAQAAVRHLQWFDLGRKEKKAFQRSLRKR